MAGYKHEFGKRWNAKVPRNDIRWLMGRVHVGTPDAEVEANIRARCVGPEYTASIIRQSIAYALECHKRNRELYTRVMRGI